MPFRYITDPLFLVCLGLYVVNRWLLEPSIQSQFFTGYVNDLICIPFCVPLMLFLLRQLRLRRDDRPPESHEIIVPLIIWSVVFEIWLPTFPLFRGLATPDHLDILAYAAGALIAGIWWSRYYNGQCPTTASITTKEPAAGDSI